MPGADLVQRLALNIGYGCVFIWEASHQQDKRSFLLRTLQDFVQERHGTGGMRQCGQSRLMQCGDQDSGGDPNRFRHVVVFAWLAILIQRLGYAEDDNQMGSRFQKRFLGIGSQRGQRIQPGLGSPVLIKFAFLLLCRFPDLFLNFRRPDYGKMPWLLVGATGRRSGGLQAVLNDLVGDGSVGKLADRSAAALKFSKTPGSLEDFRVRWFHVSR